MVRYSLLRTVLDPLLAVSGPSGLARLEFLPAAWEYHTRAHALARRIYGENAKAREDARGFAGLRSQLAEYFIGDRTSFDIDLDLQG